MTTSENLKQEAEHSLPPALDFERKSLMYCDVEYAVKGNGTRPCVPDVLHLYNSVNRGIR